MTYDDSAIRLAAVLACALLVSIAALSACGDDDGPPGYRDPGAARDTGPLRVDTGIADMGTVPDTSMSDTGTVPEMGMSDMGTVPDMGTAIDAGSCAQPTGDPSHIGDDCSDSMVCPTGYTCQGFSGVVFQQSCQILCTASCECPTGLGCNEVSDKGSTWMQCGM